MKALLSFDHLVTPSIIKFFFYLGLVLSAIGALGVIGSGFSVMNYSVALGLGYIVLSLVVLAGGAVISRIVCELVLVTFMIRDELAWQRENAAPRQSN
jgi:hypothetical protein